MRNCRRGIRAVMGPKVGVPVPSPLERAGQDRRSWRAPSVRRFGKAPPRPHRRCRSPAAAWSRRPPSAPARSRRAPRARCPRRRTEGRTQISSTVGVEGRRPPVTSRRSRRHLAHRRPRRPEDPDPPPAEEPWSSGDSGRGPALIRGGQPPAPRGIRRTSGSRRGASSVVQREILRHSRPSLAVSRSREAVRIRRRPPMNCAVSSRGR